MTQAVYHSIDALYCSRIGRSIKMVWQILEAMALYTHVSPISYEAVWAICLFLEARRRASVDVQIERGGETWWIGTIVGDIRIQRQGQVTDHLCMLCVVETDSNQIISFRIASSGLEEEGAVALYRALLTRRRPQPFVRTGLLWHLPKRLMAAIPLSQDCQVACRHLGIQVEMTTHAFSLVQDIQQTWISGLAGRVLREHQCALLFDTYLHQRYGYGPLRQKKQRTADLIGYHADQTWQFPLLRLFLPQHAGRITPEGSIISGQFQYRDELLIYWPNHEVSLRPSLRLKTLVWVYLDGEVLCQAQAKEQRRAEGMSGEFHSRR